MSLVDELKTIPQFNGHLAYRHESSGDLEWVYSVGINSTTVDVITAVDHTQWTPEELKEFVDHVRNRATASHLNLEKDVSNKTDQ